MNKGDIRTFNTNDEEEKTQYNTQLYFATKM